MTVTARGPGTECRAGNTPAPDCASTPGAENFPSDRHGEKFYLKHGFALSRWKGNFAGMVSSFFGFSYISWRDPSSNRAFGVFDGFGAGGSSARRAEVPLQRRKNRTRRGSPLVRMVRKFRYLSELADHRNYRTSTARADLPPLARNFRTARKP